MTTDEARQRLHLARRAMLLSDQQQILQENRRQVGNHWDWVWGQMKHTQRPPEGDDVISIGDQTHHHTHPQQPQSTAAALAQWLLGAGLIATGVGVPVGAAVIASALANGRPAIVTPAPPPEPPRPDTFTEISLQPPRSGESLP